MKEHETKNAVKENASKPENMLSEDYRQQLQEKHASDGTWGNTSLMHYDTILQLIDRHNIKSVLDYGCGKGMIGQRFREEQKQSGNKYASVQFFEYDPGIPGKDDMSTKGELLINTDVLEHIEPEYLDQVLSDMAARAQKVAFLVISCVPALHHLPDGRNAHLIIQPADWWIAKLGQYFKITIAQPVGGDLYVVADRKLQSSLLTSISQDKSKHNEYKKLKQAQIYIEQGRLTKARLTLLQIDKKAPVEALFLLGRIAFETDEMVVAANHFSEFIRQRREPEALRYLGIALSKLGRHADAITCLTTPECAAFNDDDFIGAKMTGWNRLYEPQKTIALFRELGETGTLATDAYVQALILTQDYAGAIATAEKAVEKAPENDLLWAILEKAYDTNRRFPDAVRAARKAVELKPEHAGHYSNLGLALLHSYELDESAAAFDRAIELDPLMNAPYLNRANIYRLKKDYAGEEAVVRQALEIDPTSGDVHYGLGICLLRQEKYEEGFAECEWFWHKNIMSSTRLPLTFRRWYGEDLKDKVILVYADQGVGDTIMMARYIRPLLEQHAPSKIILNVNDKLRGMFEHQYADLIKAGHVIIFDDTTMKVGPENVHFVVASTSLPHVMGTRIDNIPGAQSYISKQKTLDYKTATQDFVVGISWHTKSMDSGWLRSLELADFAFLAKHKNVRVINLQYGDTLAQREEAKTKGLDIFNDETVDAWSDLQAFADQVAACDLVISIDNTTVHVAGALGVPAWVILPQDPFWRWPVSGNATPWYDSLRLFRPQPGAPYKEVLTDLEAALEKRLATGKEEPHPFKPLYPAAPRKKTAFIINDTGSCFAWGNNATMQGIKSALTDKGYDIQTLSVLELPVFADRRLTLQDFDDATYLSACRYRDPTLFHHLQHADAVIINGEGLMNSLSDPALQMMYLAYVAKEKFGRKVAIINHTCFPEGGMALTDPQGLAFYMKVYKVLDGCCVREAGSYTLLQALQLPVEQGFEASVLWVRDYLKGKPARIKGNYAVITAGPGYGSQYAEVLAKVCGKLRQVGLQPVILMGAQLHVGQEDRFFAEDMQELVGQSIEVITAKSLEEFADTLRRASLALTGPFQTSVMSYAMGVPTIPVTTGSNFVALKELMKICDIAEPLSYQMPDLADLANKAIKWILNQHLKSEAEIAENLDRLCAQASKNLRSF